MIPDKWQILQYTDADGERQAVKTSQSRAEKLLEYINETIRDQEGQEKLKMISENLWIGHGCVAGSKLTYPLKEAHV